MEGEKVRKENDNQIAKKKGLDEMSLTVPEDTANRSR